MTLPGAELDGVGPHRLDQIDDNEAGIRPFRQRGDDVFNRSLGCKFDCRIAQSEPVGAKAHLRDGFLTRNVDCTVAETRERTGGLYQEGRLTDAGVAADQQHRAAHESTAGDAVELGHARRQPGRFIGLAG